MPRGNNHRGRGYRGSQGRGGAGTSAGRGRGRHNYPHPNDEFDNVIQVWNEYEETAFLPRGAGGKRGKGRSGGQTPRSGAGTPMRGTQSPRRGNDTPRGRGGRGRGQYDSPRPHPGFGANRGARGGPPKVLDRNAPLSNLLYSERPLLRPVVFVRAKLTPFLFQQSEELLKPVSDDTGTTEESHVPTAERVARVFSGNRCLDPTPDDEASASDELEEVDFADLGKIRAEVDAVVAKGEWQERPLNIVETFTGTYRANEATNVVDLDQSSSIKQDHQDTTSSGGSPELTADTLGKGFDNLEVSMADSTEVTQSALVIENDSIPIGYQSDSREALVASSSSQVASNAPEFLHGIQQAVAMVAPTDACSRDHSSTEVFPDPEPSLQRSPTPDAVLTDDSPLFVIDTEPKKPSLHRSASDVILVDRMGGGETFGEDDELIVYVAPHPRSGRSSPEDKVPRVKLPTTSILAYRSLLTSEFPAHNPVVIENIQREDNATPAMAIQDAQAKPQLPQFSSLALDFTPSTPTRQPRERPVFTPSERAKAKLRASVKEKRVRRRRQDKRHTFGSFGAMLSEARLREEDERERHHPKWETRRKDDSDIDWGDEDEDDREVVNGLPDENDVDVISNGLGGMDLDPDVGSDPKAMKGFLKSMSTEGSRSMTIDDIEDEERMRQEDEDAISDGNSDIGHSDSDSGEDSDEEVVLQREENILIGESEDEDPSSGGDDNAEEATSEESDEDVGGLSPNAGFQARLRKIREKSKGKQSKGPETSNDDEDDEDLSGYHDSTAQTRGDDDEEYLAYIDKLMEENTTILTSPDRKKRKEFFRKLTQKDVYDHDSDDDVVHMQIRKKGKKNRGSDLPTKLRVQWEKDRAKKAEHKRKREEARRVAALDPSSEKKGGKKGQKATKAADAIVDIASLERQIRAFVQGWKPNMAFPRMNKASRKAVHELALAFGLKSHSKGKGVRRYTTLVKTNPAGVNEKKVRAILNRFEDQWSGNGKKPRMPKHRDGDEVGKEAPKIGEGNIGFKMLASMGWVEGIKIGGDTSVGIDVPLTAIIKNSKLGLGASR